MLSTLLSKADDHAAGPATAPGDWAKAKQDSRRLVRDREQRRSVVEPVEAATRSRSARASTSRPTPATGQLRCRGAQQGVSPATSSVRPANGSAELYAGLPQRQARQEALRPSEWLTKLLTREAPRCRSSGPTRFNCPACNTPVRFDLRDERQCRPPPRPARGHPRRQLPAQGLPGLRHARSDLEPEFTYIDFARAASTSSSTRSRSATAGRSGRRRPPRSSTRPWARTRPRRRWCSARRSTRGSCSGWPALIEKILARQAGIDDRTLEVAKIPGHAEQRGVAGARADGTAPGGRRGRRSHLRLGARPRPHASATRSGAALADRRDRDPADCLEGRARRRRPRPAVDFQREMLTA